ncbi:uncharacterized protein YjbJ (UPF0337 family) [Rhodanobacter sp. MP1X3]|nr:uncharacterized protein YjbJ (UPF0337 family) [Rhodanobacter sp. MP1X3]
MKALNQFDRRYLLNERSGKNAFFYVLHDASPSVVNNINQPQRFTRMNEDQVEGTVNKVAGRIQDAAGALTGDADQQVKGKARAAAGDVQAKAGDMVERVREWAADRPLNAVLITAGLAFLLGRLTANCD